MMSTDRAFIAALQQASVTPGPSVASEPASPRSSHARAPLSEHLARRRAATESAVPTESPRPFRAGVELEGFPWPPLVERLAAESRPEILSLLSAATRAGSSAETPVVAITGVGPSVGTTSMLLATAKLVGDVGGKVAMLDASRSAGAAAQLGVRRSLGAAFGVTPDAIDDFAVSARQGGATVLALAGDAAALLARAAIARLAPAHDLILIDAGEAIAAAGWLGGAIGPTTATLLTDVAGGNDGERAVATERLITAGVAPIGLVETLATTAARRQ